ncbi:MAG: thiamine pyrophosphate-binding protein [Desulfurococcales archaeon]|nr:thiamine pyrophosphate-binding protein [Desulfurococcales archaeon]
MPRGHELIAETIAREGVRTVFSLPDGFLLPIYEELEKRNVNVITMRNEFSAAQAAEGWARFNRGLGVVMAPVGPGGVYLLPGLVQAMHSGSPVLAIAGRTPIKNLDRMAFEELNLSNLAANMVKYARTCISARHLARCLGDAVRTALSGRMGPVLLEIPRDIALDECDCDIEVGDGWRTTRRIFADPGLVKKAGELLERSSKPVMILGSGAYWSDACSEALRLARKAGIPVLTTGFAVGCIPYDDPHYVGHAALGIPGSTPDLLLTIGTRWDEFLGFGSNPQLYPEGIPSIHVDIDPRVVGKNRRAEVAIWADAKSFLSQLYRTIRRGSEARKKWVQIARNTFDEIQEMSDQVATPGDPVKPQYLVKTLREAFSKSTQYILDGGDTTGWGYMYLRAYYPGQVMWAHGPLGGIGAGIPVSIAAQVANPHRRTVLLTGDGSFLIGAHEIETAARYCLPVTIVIADDTAWGDVYHNWLVTGGNEELAKYALLQYRDYSKLAESLGAQGFQVEDSKSLKKTLARIARSKDCQPKVIHVKISQKETGLLNQVLLRER